MYGPIIEAKCQAMAAEGLGHTRQKVARIEDRVTRRHVAEIYPITAEIKLGEILRLDRTRVSRREAQGRRTKPETQRVRHVRKPVEAKSQADHSRSIRRHHAVRLSGVHLAAQKIRRRITRG